jgi:lipoyl(octanoyl) transferase
LKALCRSLPYAETDGPRNMAADEALLQSAIHGTASLRFYGWTTPTISIGYFQPERIRQDEQALATLPFVRRASGGATLVHHHEVTYALALPPGAPWQTRISWLQRMHVIIAAALTEFGISAHLHRSVWEPSTPSPLCYLQHAPCDLLIGSSKIVGSAQRKQRGALMQHGGILLAGSPYTPALPGIQEPSGRCLTVAETCDSVRRAFIEQTGWEIEPGDWTASERQAVAELAANKYSQDWWNRKR